MQVKAGIPPTELRATRERLLETVEHHELAGYVLFDQHYIRYFTSFNFLSTERPVVFAQSASGEMVVFVPEFEVERVRAETDFERVESYPEYPGIEHPMLILGRILADLGMDGTIGVDQDGYPGILGYQGPPLTEVTGGAGQAIGLRNHEAPFLDIGDHTSIEAGMVFTIEPGLYASDVGGFRHSDTVVVTEDGIEILTDYPRDLESLTIPV